MKNLFLTLSSVALLLTACKNEKKSSLETDKQIVFTDTSLLKPADASGDMANPGANPPAPVVQERTPQPEVRTVTKYVTVREKAPARVREPRVANTPPVMVPAPSAPTTSTPTGTGTGNTGTAGTGTDGTGTGTATPAPVKKREGWSDAAKGATIGGVGGAVAGAVIGKGAKGAIIGGVVGAAGGYILGRKKDKATAARADTVRY